ncbi:MAG TPA: dihydrofolate reductase, partial [Gammaproteobacteria bacterium]|nr:dihydrofolate reductase [Gammaproteobacteria bacterium]
MKPILKVVSMLAVILAGCTGDNQASAPPQSETRTQEQQQLLDEPAFRVETERFADVRVLRYRVPEFEALDLKTKELLYYLYEAALSGREIIYDQKYRYNLAIKRTLEEIVKHYPGDRETAEFKALLTHLKRIWFSNGIHHHYANDKFDPGFDFATFEQFVKSTPGRFPVREGQSLDELLAELRPVMFDPSVDARLVSKSGSADVLASSAVNYYRGLTQPEVEAFYAARQTPGDPSPISHGLNSQLAKRDGVPVERVWKVGGLYTQALERVVFWLERAVTVAENDAQRDALEKLIRYYQSGDLEDWDEYNVAWVKDSDSVVDVINGFIEVYEDPLGLRGAFESVVAFRDPEATRRIDALAREAQWFEDHSPILDRHKKENVTGIVGKVITVVIESGDAAPTTPVGINLPNADWIRKQHGSKSVSLANIVAAYDLVRGGAEREFAWDAAEVERGERYGELASAVFTDMHEVIGHASGQLDPGVGTLHETLKNYGSTLEEA